MTAAECSFRVMGATDRDADGVFLSRDTGTPLADCSDEPVACRIRVDAAPADSSDVGSVFERWGSEPQS